MFERKVIQDKIKINVTKSGIISSKVPFRYFSSLFQSSMMTHCGTSLFPEHQYR